jgi:dGTPase
MINEDIYKYFINDMDNKYVINTSPARIVIDFMAGMTDDFFIEQHKKYLK